ncbi:hypothetical protein [Paenibacillus woosongensis]|uniref:Import inner membrane translocase subunit Tim44 n=1 Tax=Paenibacillus woosongensis TaxID=307580 RepID=A0A7X2YZY1_9BACL|nr:hypothetical protein [Paenibacillus woosongensis]MUG45077.1 hypothetical protein [Paenibacillus woosongensis]
MFKKMTALVMVFTLLFAFASADFADARRGGGFKSGPRSYTTTPKKSSNVNKSDSNTTNKSTATPGATNNRTGFFGGGSFMKGMMVGGLAGLLFGGLFGGMGFFGELLGLAVNLIAIYLIVMVAVALFRRFKKPQVYQGPRHDDHDNRGGRF